MKIQQSFPFLFLCIVVFGGNLKPLSVNAGDIWPTNSEASLALGQASLTTGSSGNGAAQMQFPIGVCLDPDTGKVFVADAGNNRVLRFASLESLSTGDAAEAVLGQSDFGLSSSGTTSTSMSEPSGLAVGPDGALWVAENINNRVLKFENAATIATGSAADGVLGQADFSSSASAVSAAGLDRPRDVSVDNDGNLFIADMGNNRVVVHLNASLKSNGADADRVLGQADFTTKSNGTTQSTFRSPNGAHIASSGALYVCDSQNNRIMVFENALLLENGSLADRQIGQPDFTTSSEGVSAGEFDFPARLHVTGDAILIVADKDNRRVLLYSDAAGASGESGATTVLGQADFESNSLVGGVTGTSTPWDAFVDESTGLLCVADFYQNRIAIFGAEAIQPDLTVGETSGAQLGGDVYNSSGAGQRTSVRTAGKKARVYCTVGNDGSFDQGYLAAAKGSNRRFLVKCFLLTGGKTNITSAMKAGTYDTGELAASEVLSLRLDVRPKRKVKSRRANFTGWVRAVSNTDGETDKVIAKVKNRP